MLNSIIQKFCILMLLTLVIYFTFDIDTVNGVSMEPMFKEGDIILVSLYSFNFRVGDIVVVEYKNNYILKRIADINRKTGKIYLLGDNSYCSIDSRDFGWLDIQAIKGKYAYTLEKVK